MKKLFFCLLFLISFPVFAANSTLSNLTSGGALQDGDLVYIVRSGVDRKAIWVTPTAQVNADWTSLSGLSEVLNKPTLGTSSSYDIGTNGSTVPLLNGTNTFSELNNFTGGLQLNGTSVITGNQTINVTGDCLATGTTTLGLACTKTAGNAFAASATVDTTNATNITSGTLPVARLPYATATTVGGVSVGTGLSITASGVLSNTGTGAGMIYPGVGLALSTGTGWDSSVTNNSANWDTAYGWGNHASASYLTVVTATGASPLTLSATSGAITGSLLQSSATQNGYLSSTDWGTFNSKLSANQTITLSGDVTGSGTTSLTTTLANTASARTNIGLGNVENTALSTWSGSSNLVTLGAATASGLTLSGITGSTQCLHVNTSGVVSGTGSDCGSGGGSGTVDSGVVGQIAIYTATNVVEGSSDAALTNLTASTATLTTLYTTTATVNSNNTRAATTVYADRQAACDGGVLLLAVTASDDATINFTGYMTSTYKSYVVKFYNVLPVSDGVDFYVRVGAGGSYYSANYTYQYYGQAINTSSGFIPLDDAISSTASLGGISGTIKIFDPSNVVSPKTILSETLGADTNYSGNSEYVLVGGRYVGAVTAVTDVQFLFSSGNVASGTAYLCGKKH